MPRGRPKRYGPANPGRRFLARNKRLNPVQKNEVKRIIGRRFEKKFVDNAYNYALQDRTAVLTRISYNSAAGAEIIRGTGENQRIGDRITPYRLEFRMTSYYDPSLAVADATHNLRIIIFKWNDDLALGAPTAGSILQYITSGIGNYSDLTSPYNHQGLSEGQFTICLDRTISCGSSAPIRTISKVLKLRGSLDFAYNSDAAAGRGHYYVYTVADDVTGAHTPSVQLQFTTRFMFMDG